MRFLIDIDGTVVTQQKPGEYEKAVPLPGAVEAVNALYDKGHQVVFYTSRNFKYLQQTYESLKNFGFRFHHISFGKPHAEIIIDDRAVRFTSWKQAKTEIRKLLKDNDGESNG
jgi:trehalose-6-phosphatase